MSQIHFNKGELVALELQVQEGPRFLPKECAEDVATANGAVILTLELWEVTVISKDQ